MATWTKFLELEADPEYSDDFYGVHLYTDTDLYNGTTFSGKLIRDSLTISRTPATTYFDNWLYTTYVKFSFLDSDGFVELRDLLNTSAEFRCIPQFDGGADMAITFLQRPSIQITDEDPQIVTMTFSDRMPLLNDVPYADNFISDGASRSRVSSILANCLYEIGYVDGVRFIDMTAFNTGTATFLYDTYLNNADYQGKDCGTILKEILQSCGSFMYQYGTLTDDEAIFIVLNHSEYQSYTETKTFRQVIIDDTGSYTFNNEDWEYQYFNLSKTPFRVLNRRIQAVEGYSEVAYTDNTTTGTVNGVTNLSFERQFQLDIPHYNGGFVDSGGTAITTLATPSPFAYNNDARAFIDITSKMDFYEVFPNGGFFFTNSYPFLMPQQFAGEALGNFGLPLDVEYKIDSGTLRTKLRLYELDGSTIASPLDNTNYRLKSSRNKPDLVCAVDGTTGSEFHYSQDRGNSWGTNTSLASMPNSLSYACTFVNETYYVKRGGDSNWWYFNVATETAGNYDTTQTDILDATDYYDGDIKLAWVRSIDKNIYTQDEGATSFSTTTVSGITGNMKCIDAWFDVNGVGQTIAIATNSNEIAYNSTVSATGWTVVSTGSLQPERITVYKDIIYGIGHVTSGSTGYLFKVENGVYTQLGDELSTRISGFGPSVSSIEDIIRFDRYLIYAFDTGSFVNIDYFDLNKNDWRVDKAAPAGGLPTGRAITLTGHFYNNQWTNFGRDHITFIA